MLSAFGRPYLGDVFDIAPDAAVMRLCFRRFSAPKYQTRRFDNPCRRAMLHGGHPARRTSRIPRLLRGVELLYDTEHMIKKNCLDYFLDEAPCGVENRWAAGCSFDGSCEWSICRPVGPPASPKSAHPSDLCPEEEGRDQVPAKTHRSPHDRAVH
jgi:hypothetical protein